jgi:hypothetical protein
VANSKEPYILLSMYQNMYQEKYGKMPFLNKYREKWAMQDVIDSVGYARAKELLEYYFTTGKYGHPIQFFFFNFDKIDIMQTEVAKDKKNRKALQEATKRLVEGEE